MDIEVYNRDFFKKTPDKTIPERKEWVKIFKEMKIHTRGESPGELLKARRPNESEEVYDYRVSVYQKITKGPINRSISKLFRIFQSSNFSYKVNEELEAYLNEKIFHKRNFFDFFHGSITKRMIEDPNGYLAWIPAGEGLIKQTEKIKVLPELIDSDHIWFVNDDIITWYKETIEDEKLPDVFYSLTDEGYYEHVRQKDVYVLELIYPHNLKMLPAIILGGTLREDGILESYFDPFLPFGNEAIRRFSDDQEVGTTSSFPYRTEKHTECDFPQCSGKGWYEEDINGKCVAKKCAICHGTGQKPHTSPFGVFVRKETGPGEEPDTTPMVEFTSPSVDIVEHSLKTWQVFLKLARESIFDIYIEEAQSGVAKIVDREDLHAFMSGIADNVYDHLLLNSLIIINNYRDISSTEKPEVTKPTSFIVKTESDLVNELSTLIEKETPLPFILETVRDLAKKRFATNEKAHKKIEFLLVYDPLFALSPDEKNMITATEVIDEEVRNKNINAYQVLSRLMMTNPDLLDESYESIAKKMDAEIKKLIPEKTLVFNESGES